LVLVLLWGWARERRSLAHRRVMQRLYRLGEELVASRSFAESLRLLQSVLPELLKVSEVRVYVLDRSAEVLQRVEWDASSGLPQSTMLVEEPDGFRRKWVELCYRNRGSIVIPDTRRSPLPDSALGQHTPRSAMFLPMFAQGEALGVLAVGDARRVRQFSEEERAVAQHLANQIAIGMRLLEQRSLREQAGGGEALGAICRLVSAAAGELKNVLPAAPKAEQALSRILEFARLQQEQGRPVDLAAVLRDLVRLRQDAWKQQGLYVRDLIAPEPLFVASRSGTLEQALLSLLWHAQRSLEPSRERTVTLRAFRLAAMAQLDISWPGSAQDLETAAHGDGGRWFSEDVYSFPVCRELIRVHGGELRLSKSADGAARIEVALPLTVPEVLGAAAVPRTVSKPATRLTALVLEPDAEARQTLLSALCDLGHRSVTAASAEEAAELVRRLRFDVCFCSSALSGEGWLSCFENLRAHVRSFVVLTKGHDPALASALPAGAARVLAKPVRADELSQLLGELEPRGAAGER
jgi:GAF domain-containing protein/ActR/RegA family two-component response regulator